MRTEDEIRALLARFTEEYHRAQAEQVQSMVLKPTVNDHVYQITLQRTEWSIRGNMALLYWMLGEVELPVTDS